MGLSQALESPSPPPEPLMNSSPLRPPSEHQTALCHTQIPVTRALALLSSGACSAGAMCPAARRVVSSLLPQVEQPVLQRRMGLHGVSFCDAQVSTVPTPGCESALISCLKNFPNSGSLEAERSVTDLHAKALCTASHGFSLLCDEGSTSRPHACGSLPSSLRSSPVAPGLCTGRALSAGCDSALS